MTDLHVEDIEFCTLPGHTLMGRYYRPQASAPFPLLVDVHGGAWTKGDRFNNQVMHRYLASQGIGVFALDFRMPPAVRYPDTVADVNTGIRWVKRHAERLGTEPSLIGGLGTSSGGHLLMLNVLQPTHDAYVRDADGIDASLAYAIACWSILDPLARYEMAQRLQIASLLDAHHAFWPDTEHMGRANPHRIVERGEHTHLPPALLIQGTGDQNVEHFRADLFGEVYRAAGGRIDVRKYDDVHMFVTSTPDTANSHHALETIRDFVRANTSPG